MLEGTVGSDGKPIKAVGASQLKILRAAREEVSKRQCRHVLQKCRTPTLCACFFRTRVHQAGRGCFLPNEASLSIACPAAGGLRCRPL